ncbi:fumarylacetoacetate hydrolase family protein [uncultured Ferrovibrio sp.]|jgi:2-keto-4-pentenoate hydratase/2-oxohepta-3-ene-1,7-dioic acid hydratase in catechol pathway|uniref:fumarylacetoacetate hydrolase family protein n=1 Tax=uncultured Ferrovibrio sp. TaxID=1576913 RepID=UPI00260ECA9F|nr:fumarylacetoacetate hydrolase family protein [uncultured Ferrovibrio sp.]
MRLLNYLKAGKPTLGARKGDAVVDLTAAGLPDSVDALLALGPDGLRKAQDVADKATATTPLAEVTLLPPVLNPSKAIAVGLNYIDHAAESPYKDAPKYPVLFHRFPSSWVAHNQPLIRPRVSEQFDYEAELAVIIGKTGRYIPKEQALDYVAGYSLFNDGSIRDYQFKSHQWMIGKNFDASGSFGPELVTADELPPGAVGLRLQARLNGQVLQDANTKDMIFDVATLVSTCSEVFALRPGDVIISGTPAGVGFARKPPIFMKEGDVIEVEVDKVGILRNTVKNE